MRFKKIDDDISTATVGVHMITKQKSWFRLGGWQYTFDCSCGWEGQKSGMGGGKTNEVAIKHFGEIQ